MDIPNQSLFFPQDFSFTRKIDQHVDQLIAMYRANLRKCIRGYEINECVGKVEKNRINKEPVLKAVRGGS
jgi:hypothetical protein